MKLSIKHLLKKRFYNTNSAFWIEIKGYWQVYGGTRAIFASQWLWMSFFLTLILYPKWLFNDWTNLSLGILPSLLGFSIGAMALIFTFPSTAIFKLIAWNGNSYYLEQAARFVHFVLIQIIAILFSIFASTHYFSHSTEMVCSIPTIITIFSIIKNFIAFLAFIYALATAAATVFSLFGVAQIYNQWQSNESEKSKVMQDNTPQS